VVGINDLTGRWLIFDYPVGGRIINYIPLRGVAEATRMWRQVAMSGSRKRRRSLSVVLNAFISLSASFAIEGLSGRDWRRSRPVLIERRTGTDPGETSNRPYTAPIKVPTANTDAESDVETCVECRADVGHAEVFLLTESFLVSVESISSRRSCLWTARAAEIDASGSSQIAQRAIVRVGS
jgi:hypothetical protein